MSFFKRVFTAWMVYVSIFGSSQGRAEEWTIDAFLTSLMRNEPRTIDEALQGLPDSVRSSYTLLYQGHGLRGTSYERPGVILFSNRGEYAITFGDASLALGDEIEIARFDRERAKVDLYKAVFAKDGSSAPIQVVKSPAECVRCHTADSKFLWASYADWPGVYGSEDDAMDVNVDGRDVSPIETKNFPAFRDQMSRLERYRTLLPPKGEKGIPPYDDDSPFSPYTKEYKDRRLTLRPNLRLSSVVSRIDGLRAARKIMESPTYARDRIVLLRTFLGCPKASLLDGSDAEFGRVELRSLLKKMGVSMDEFEANILELPVRSRKYPYYEDGVTDLPDHNADPDVDEYYPWGNNHQEGTPNSIAGIAVASLYADMVKAYPELPLAYKSSQDAGYYGTDFERYPNSKIIAQEIGSIAEPIYLAQKDNTAFCTALIQASGRAAFDRNSR